MVTVFFSVVEIGVRAFAVGAACGTANLRRVIIPRYAYAQSPGGTPPAYAPPDVFCAFGLLFNAARLLPLYRRTARKKQGIMARRRNRSKKNTSRAADGPCFFACRRGLPTARSGLVFLPFLLGGVCCVALGFACLLLAFCLRLRCLGSPLLLAVLLGLLGPFLGRWLLARRPLLRRLAPRRGARPRPAPPLPSRRRVRWVAPRPALPVRPAFVAGLVLVRPVLVLACLCPSRLCPVLSLPVRLLLRCLGLLVAAVLAFSPVVGLLLRLAFRCVRSGLRGGGFCPVVARGSLAVPSAAHSVAWKKEKKRRRRKRKRGSAV